MARLFLWMMRLVVGSIVLIGLVSTAIYLFLTRSIPEYSATHSIAGLSAPVEIVRNNANVPHILAETDADAFFALGFAHAQDRLWQMTLLRRTAQGRLSEVFGNRTLQTDELMRRLDIYGLAVSSLAAQDDDTRAALEAYSRGVNAWIDIVNRDALGRGAPEFFMFSNEIAVWQPADSIAILKLLAVQMSSHLQSEVLRARISLLLPEERVADILPDDPTKGIAALPDYAALVPGGSAIPARDYAALVPGATGIATSAGPADLYPIAPYGLAGASNAWAAAGERSAAGGALLASDPHLPFTAPSVWYLARMTLRSGSVIGGTIPGVPLVLEGRNDRLGWGITSSYVDDQDLYVEKLNPDNPQEYQSIDGFVPFRTRKTIIRIKDEAPQTFTLRWTDNGPVIPGSHADLASITPPGHVISVAWTALDPADTTMTAGLHAMKAQNIDEAIAAGELYVAPSQNVVLADQTGIALQTLGAIPRRNSNHQSLGRLPTPGWLEVNRWEGRLNYEANPRFVAPEGGIVANTNNKLLDRPFPQHVSYDWGDTQRIQRLTGLLQAREVHTRESFIEAQLDTVSVSARALLPLIAADLWFTGEAAPEGTPERLRQRALTLLAEWSGEMNEHLPEPLIYTAWMRALQERLIRDDLGPVADALPRVDPLFLERVFRNIDGASVWCDVLQSSAAETCADIARKSLDDALLSLTERYGSLDSWRWGDVHQATQDHPVLGGTPILRLIVNIRQSTSGGDDTLMRGMTRGAGRDPYLNVHGAGFRGVYDFADPESSLFVISTGQSGHPLSRHYDDLGEVWRKGEYIPMSLDPELARAAAVGITHLVPQP